MSAPYDKAGRRLQPRPAFDKQGRRIPRRAVAPTPCATCPCPCHRRGVARVCEFGCPCPCHDPARASEPIDV